MRPRHPTALAAMLALLAAGCGHCGKPAAEPPERWVPGDAWVAVVVPRLERAASELGALARTAGAVPAAAGLAEALAAVRAQLGLDPLDPAGLASAGLDPAGAAAFAQRGVLLDFRQVLVLPVADAGKLDAFLARLARDRLGAGTRQESRLGEATVVTYRRGAGGTARLAWALRQRTAVIAADEDDLAAAVELPAERSLQASAPYRAARAALGEGQTALLYAPPASPLAGELPAARDGGALGLRAGGAGLWARAVLLLPPAREEVWREVAGGPAAAAAGREELARLPGDLFAAGRFGGDPQALLRRLGYLLPPELAGRLARARIDPARDLGARLSPGGAVGLSLSPAFDAGALARGVGAAARDPFRLVHLVAVQRVRDPAALRAELDRLARAGPALGLRIVARRGPDGTPVWSAALGGGTLAWALAGERLLLAGGAGRLETLRAGGAGFAPPTPAARAALESGGAAAAVDFPGLVRSVRALPSEAFGTGPDGFVMRALVERFLEPASHLAAASARLEVIQGAARLDVAVEALAP